MTGSKRWVPLAAGVLIALHVLALSAGFVAPYDFKAQYREFAYAPPTRIHLIDQEGRWHMPFVYAPAAGGAEAGRGERVPIRLFSSGSDDGSRRLFAVDAPARLFILGTDKLGRDVFSRILYGAQMSLLAGLLAATFSVGLGLALGTTAGYYGGRTDEILMRLTELFLALPWLYLLFGVRAVMPLELSPGQAFLIFVAIVGGIGWARPARLFRGLALSLKKRDFLVAAHSLGASDGHLLRRHVLPHAMSVFWTQLALLVPKFILAEVTLSFLGLGVQEPRPSWGNMLTSLREYNVLVSYGWMFAPAAALLVVVLCYQVLADYLQERGRART